MIFTSLSIGNTEKIRKKQEKNLKQRKTKDNI